MKPILLDSHINPLLSLLQTVKASGAEAEEFLLELNLEVLERLAVAPKAPRTIKATVHPAEPAFKEPKAPRKKIGEAQTAPLP